MKELSIVIDDYPGWTTSISPFRLTVNGNAYRPMTKAEVLRQVEHILDTRLVK